MALVFNEQNIQIDFLSDFLNDPTKKFNARTVILPVFRYKIYAPRVNLFKLNIFQKTVLSILNKGNYRVQQISEWLNLDTELIKMVLSELGQKELSNNGVITNKGREIIEETFSWFNVTEDIKKDIYYIYQDIFTQKLYSSFITYEQIKNFKYIDRKIHKNDGTTISAVFIEPRNIQINSIEKPEIDEIFKNVTQQIDTKEENLNNENKEELSGDKDRLNKQIPPPNLIEYLDSEATLCYLATTIYIENDSTDLDDLKVKDPFDLKEQNYILKENLLKSSKSNKFINDILESLIFDAKKVRKNEMGEILKEVRVKIEEDLTNKFNYKLQVHHELYKSLKDLYIDLALFEMDNTQGKYLKEAVKNAQTVLETLFNCLTQKYPEGYKNAIEVDPKLNNLYIEEITKKIKSINAETIIPNWQYQKFASHIIKPALVNPKKASLRALYIGAILATWYDHTNSMYLFIKNKNDLLEFLEKVANGRNDVGHKYKDIPNTKISEYYKEVLDIKNGVDEILQIFLEGN